MSHQPAPLLANAVAQPVRRVVCVTGTPHSGAALMASALSLLGVQVGTEHGADRDRLSAASDPVLTRMTEQVINVYGAQPDDLSMPDIEVDQPLLRTLRQRTVEHIGTAYGGDRAWGFADPLVARALPFWRAVFRDAGCSDCYVIVVRHPLSVSTSMLASANLQTAMPEALWLQHGLFAITHTLDRTRVVVDYDRLVDDPEAQLRRVAAALELMLPEGDVSHWATQLIDAKHRHSFFSTTENVDDIDPPSTRLYRILNCLAQDIPLTIEDEGSLTRLPEVVRDMDPVLAALDEVTGRAQLVARVLEHELVIHRLEGRRKALELGWRIEELEKELQDLRQIADGAASSNGGSADSESRIRALEAEYLTYRSLVRHRAADSAYALARKIPGVTRLVQVVRRRAGGHA